MIYKFVIIICLRIFGSVKRGDRTPMWGEGSPPNVGPKLEPIHRTMNKVAVFGEYFVLVF